MTPVWRRNRCGVAVSADYKSRHIPLQLLDLLVHRPPQSNLRTTPPSPSASMSKTYQGQCHCGAVQWKVDLDADSQAHILCHCEACKLQSGGEYTLNTLAPKDAFTLTKGDLKVYTYKGDSGNPVDCYFCANCTSSPYHHQVSLTNLKTTRTTRRTVGAVVEWN